MPWLSATLVLAWLIDAAFGEPPDRWHPVAWLGRVLGPLGRLGSRWSSTPAFVAGSLAWIALAFGIGSIAWAVERRLDRLPPWVAAVPLALLLKPCFAWRMLRDEVAAVEVASTRSLDEGRLRVARLCSRDVRAMDAFEVRETAIETLAENLNDSLVAPLFWFVVAGLPGAAVYRFANTVDAMWGYRGRFEWFGKWPARADDALSWLPARITAALLMACGSSFDVRRVRIEAARTPSPNGGWPMAAMASCVGVRLRKPGVYALNAAARSPGPADARRALRLASIAAWSAAGLSIAACLVKDVVR